MSKIKQQANVKAKETIYVDVEDEITSIIDRVTETEAKVVALVLPKRATTMQSTVNMRLLKRAADTSGKNVVLVTNESGLLPLAGMVGLHVSPTPTSKPVIPPAPNMADESIPSIDEPIDIHDSTAEGEEDFDVESLAAVPVGVLADTADDDSILMPDDPVEEAPVETPAAPVKEKDKKLKVPSFNKFRWGVVIGVLALILLVTGWIFAAIILPKAGIAIATDSTTVETDMSLTLDTTVKELDEENAILPATAQSLSKTYTQEVPATGELNSGEKATGTVYFALDKSCSVDEVTIPAGSGVSVGGNIYITQGKLELMSTKKGSTCNPSDYQDDWSGTVKVIAMNAGAKFNAASGTNASLSSSVSGASTVNAKVNQAITGGTDVITKIVAQADIDGAKAKITEQDTSGVKADLEGGLKNKNLLPVPSTLLAGDQQVTSSANPGDKADTVKVTVTVPYTMLGVNQEDVKTLVLANIKENLKNGEQEIIDDGMDSLKFSQESPATPTNAVVALKTRSVAGPVLNVEDIKTQAMGKKSNEVKTDIESITGVESVEVAFSPFWVNTVPKNADKITVIIDGETK